MFNKWANYYYVKGMTVRAFVSWLFAMITIYNIMFIFIFVDYALFVRFYYTPTHGIVSFK